MQAMSSTVDGVESRTFAACGVFKEDMLAHSPGSEWSDLLAFRIEANGQVTNNKTGPFPAFPFHDLSAIKRFKVTSENPWIFKTLANESGANGKRQLETLFKRLREGMVAMVARQRDRESPPVWEQIFRDDVEEFYMTHSNTDCVRMVAAAFLPRAASWQRKDLVAESKKSMVDRLMQAQVLLCFPEVCGMLHASMGAGHTPGATPLQAGAVAGTGVVLSTPPGKEEVVRPVAVATPPKVRVSKRKVIIDTSSSGSDSEGAVSSTNLAKTLGMLVKKLSKERVRVSADKATQGATPPFQRHMDELKAAILRFDYVNPVACSPSHLEKVRRSKSGFGGCRLAPKALTLDQALSTVVTGDKQDVPVANDLHMGEFSNGFDFILEVLLSSATHAPRATDMLQWKALCVGYVGAAMENKVAYMQEFMYRFQGEGNANDWVGKFKCNQYLISQYMTPQTPTSRQARTDSSRGGRGRLSDGSEGGFGGGGRVRQPRHRGGRPFGRELRDIRDVRDVRDDRSQGSREGREAVPRRGASKAVCRSRMIDGVSCPMRQGECKFSHVCPCCHADHEGASAACKKWDVALMEGLVKAAPFRK